MTKRIKLTKGKTALVDDEDFERVNQYKWQAAYVRGGHWYAMHHYGIPSGIRGKRGKQMGIFMHRLIMNPPKGIIIDHKDGNGLNNCKSNLRFATHSQNNQNAIKNSRSRWHYKGVYHHTNPVPRWAARIRINHKTILLGYFKTERDAALAYNKAAIEYFGEFAKLNEVDKYHHS